MLSSQHERPNYWNGNLLYVRLAYWSRFTNRYLLTVSSHNNLLSSDKGACSVMDSIPVFFANSCTPHHREMCLQPMDLGCSGFLSFCCRKIPQKNTLWNDACILSHNSRLQPTTAGKLQQQEPETPGHITPPGAES